MQEKSLQNNQQSTQLLNRIRLHAVQCNANIILIYSHNTDVYNIGLSHISQHSTASYFIQLNKISTSTNLK